MEEDYDSLLHISKGNPGRDKFISKGRRHKVFTQEVDISSVKVVERH